MDQKDAQLNAVLGNEPACFEALISHLMSAGNEQRSQAEAIFNACKERHPDLLALKLVNVLRSCPQVETKSMTAILLRTQITRSDTHVWPRLASTTQTAIKAHLLSCLQYEEEKSVVKKISDAVVALAATIIEHGQWPELLPFMFHSVSSDSPRSQEFGLFLFAKLSPYIAEHLQPHLETLLDVFKRFLRSPCPAEIGVAALRASTSLVLTIHSSSDREKFQELLPLMMQALTEALNRPEEPMAQEALEIFIELAESEPMFLRGQLPNIVSGMLHIATAEGLDKGTRHLAIEFIVTLAEARERAPGMMRKFPQFIDRFFAILMDMLVDIEDDPAWHSTNCEDEYAGQMKHYSIAQESLDRLSISLGGNAILPVAFGLLPLFLADPDWRRKHAALVAIAQIAEGCAKVMCKNLGHVVNMVLKSFDDQHPRVRWAAINAIGQLSTDLGPHLVQQYHHVILPVLVRAIDDFENPRVQAHAASAVINFTENCTPEILEPYMDEIVEKLLVLLQNGRQMVQEGALTALASVADSSQEGFQKYYERVMPSLKFILVTATDKSSYMLRAKSLECITLVGMAVGKDKFRVDAKQIMEVLMTLQGSQMEAHDPTISYMLQAWARLCKCLGQEFLPYMNVVMPPLLRSAHLKPDVKISYVDSENDFVDPDDESFETIILGDKKISIKTSILEEKATACNMLCCYADELKEGFFPWIDQVATVMVPLLRFYFHEEVRKSAVLAMPALLCAAKLAVEKGQAQGREQMYIKQLSNYIITALVEALQKEPETEMCFSMLNALNECIQISGILTEGRVKIIVNALKEVLTASANRKRELKERANAEDFDAEESEILQEENEKEEEIFDQIGECIGKLLKIFKASFLPFFADVSSYVTVMLGNDKTAEERRIAICIFDDVAEQCQETAIEYYDTYLPFLLGACHDSSVGVRQAAVYGIGVCAQFGGSKFKRLVGEALSKLDSVICKPNSREPDNVLATDNAISALGKICQWHRDCIDAAQVVPAWLSCLPIKGDVIEAKIVHEQLCRMVERSDADLLGLNNQYLPKIVAVFTEVLCAGGELATEQTCARIVDLLRKLQQTLPPSALASTWSNLQPQQQLALQSILSS